MTNSTAPVTAQDRADRFDILATVMDKAAARDISIAELARRCEMSKPRLERKLANPKRFTVIDVFLLANAFGEQPSDFLDSLVG